MAETAKEKRAKKEIFILTTEWLTEGSKRISGVFCFLERMKDKGREVGAGGRVRCEALATVAEVRRERSPVRS